MLYILYILVCCIHTLFCLAFCIIIIIIYFTLPGHQPLCTYVCCFCIYAADYIYYIYILPMHFLSVNLTMKWLLKITRS